jgi:hypothetical protein
MNSNEALLQELENTDDILLDKITPGDNYQVAPEIAESLTKGKEGIAADVAAERLALGGEEPPIFGPGPGAGMQPSQEKGKISYQMDELINAEAAVNLIGWGMPMAGVILARVLPIDFGEDAKIKKEMGLTAQDKKALEKPLERLLAETKIGTASPLLAFLVVFLTIFVTKMAMLYIDSDNDDTPQRSERIIKKRQRKPAPRRPAPAPRPRISDRNILVNFKPNENFN